MKPLVAAVVALVATLGAVDCLCPYAWAHYEDNCYLAYNISLDWHTAREICRETEPGADLASINNLMEHAFLTTEYGYLYSWIGLNDISTEGTYVWSNGDSYTYQNWFCDRPVTTSDYDCIHMTPITPYNGGWANRPCDDVNSFICKMSRLDSEE